MIVFEGIDGSGKGTQSRLCSEALLGAGVAVRHVSFPAYGETFFGKEIGNFLDGRFGSLHDVHPKLAAMLFAGDRFEKRSSLVECLNGDITLVVDRYVASNIAHQSAKLPADERPGFVTWVEKLEYSLYALPRPDLTVFLDVPPRISMELVARKSRRDYTEKTHDIQEASDTYLEDVYAVYRSLSKDPSWVSIPCTKDSGICSVGDIHREVMRVVGGFLGLKQRS
jgi:dTMP kinase